MEKRNRSFQLKQSDKFPWVGYEHQKMFCTLCVKFPDLSGGMVCVWDHLATLKSHDQSIKHLACTMYARLVSLHNKSSSVIQTVSKIPNLKVIVNNKSK